MACVMFMTLSPCLMSSGEKRGLPDEEELVWLNLFDSEVSPERYSWWGMRSQVGEEGGTPGGG